MSAVENVTVAVDPWMNCMRRGDFARAWEISDAALRARAGAPCWHWPRHQQYVWNGESLEGRRVLVRCYHGLGDTLQFIRFAPLLKQIAAEVIVWAQPVLIPLLRTMKGIDRLLPLHDGVPEVEFDVDVEVMELAHVFRVTPETLPAEIPYLHAEPASWTREVGRNENLAVGIVWRAGNWNERRSIPEELIAPLARVPGVTLQAFQQGATTRGPIEPVAELARAIRGLDLLITVDSLPAHLAGALGVPTWTLLPTDADWRWMEEREDTPWYPTMKLWRQERAGDWRAVIERMVDELKLRAKGLKLRAGV